ncbi:hypothetical protein BGX38DRAFT_739165 [Terfezia claveryi]|nr:hypothetical protein BGX38DRAFT_739165 [Terfezia claveryi]
MTQGRTRQEVKQHGGYPRKKLVYKTLGFLGGGGRKGGEHRITNTRNTSFSSSPSLFTAPGSLPSSSSNRKSSFNPSFIDSIYWTQILSTGHNNYLGRTAYCATTIIHSPYTKLKLKTQLPGCYACESTHCSPPFAFSTANSFHFTHIRPRKVQRESERRSSQKKGKCIRFNDAKINFPHSSSQHDIFHTISSKAVTRHNKTYRISHFNDLQGVSG